MLRATRFLTPQLRVFVRYESSSTYNAAVASLKKDLKQAMIAKDDLKKTTIRGLLSTIKNKEIDSKDKNLDEFVLSEVYSKLINQRKDSINDFLQNGREDLVAKEKQELEIIQSYLQALPVASKEEIDSKVAKLLNELREEDHNLQLKQVFSKIDWKTIPLEWKASSNMIKSSIVNFMKSS